MKRLYFLNEIYEAEKIIKKGDSIIGYNGDSEDFTFKGITNWSLFSIEGGFDPDPEQEKEQHIADIEAAIAALLGGAIG